MQEIVEIVPDIVQLYYSQRCIMGRKQILQHVLQQTKAERANQSDTFHIFPVWPGRQTTSQVWYVFIYFHVF